jgi:hypothetical protein
MAKRRFLVMARVGDKSLHQEWLLGAERSFDLYLSYYGATKGRYAGDADYWRERKGPKWPILHEHIIEDSAIVAGYEAVWFPDDDLSVDAAGINRMFALFTENGLALAQPALTKDSYFSHECLLQDDACVLRYVNFVEVMAPVLSASSLDLLGRTFGQSPSGWGLDHVWPTLLRASDAEAKVAIIDAAPVRHTRPVGGELYQNNPHLSGWADLERVQALYPQCDLRTHPKDKFFVSAVEPSAKGVGMVEVCLCTHNPRAEILAKTIRSLAAQDVRPGTFRLTLIDNSSSPPVAEQVLDPMREAGIEARILREPAIGLQRARLCAIRRTSADWILWVDDDNELAHDFISQGISFIRSHPEVGCFGGRLLLPESLSPAPWVRPFLPYLGIRDFGDAPIVERLRAWGPAEPPGAGAWVRRTVVNAYLAVAAKEEGFFRLGRVGASDLASCDDSCMMRCADRVGLSCAYAPALRLWHHLSPHRFRLGYLMRLMRAFGRSLVLLETTMNPAGETPSAQPQSILPALIGALRTYSREGWIFACGRVAFELGADAERRRQAALRRGN